MMSRIATARMSTAELLELVLKINEYGTAEFKAAVAPTLPSVAPYFQRFFASEAGHSATKRWGRVFRETMGLLERCKASEREMSRGQGEIRSAAMIMLESLTEMLLDDLHHSTS